MPPNTQMPREVCANIILASASPRRKELLEQIGISVSCYAVDIDETPHAQESPADLVQRLALGKAGCCRERLLLAHNRGELSSSEDTLIVGADTIIDLDGASLGKPDDREHAVATLLSLANRDHFVHTGVAVVSLNGNIHKSKIVTTTVSFGPVTEADAIRYWESGEPSDKAGSYGIQGLGAQFVAHLSGSYSNVVGLPLYEVLSLLRAEPNSNSYE